MILACTKYGIISFQASKLVQAEAYQGGIDRWMKQKEEGTFYQQRSCDAVHNIRKISWHSYSTVVEAHE